MRRLMVLAPLLALAACATTDRATVRLDASKAFLTAQLGFKSAQQSALAGIRSGVVRGETKTRVLDLAAKGADVEAKGYAAARVLDVATQGQAAVKLTDVVAGLVRLGAVK